MAEQSSYPRCARIVPAPVRNAVRALIVQHNQVLMLRKRNADGSECFSLPGGGQDSGEALHEALHRECLEEIGAPVEIIALVHVADAFKRRDGKSARYRQHVEFLFRCRLPADYLPRAGSRPDRSQIAVEWVGLQHLDVIELRPPGMARLIHRCALGQGPVYVGVL